MAKVNALLFGLNAGEVSYRAMARVDQSKLRLAADQQENLIPRVMGGAMMRPGTEYITSTSSNNKPQFIPFVFNTETKALVELTASLMRVLVDDTPVTRVSVTTAVSNSAFGSNLTSWTDNDEAGATSDWVTGGYMGLTGNGFAYAIRYQQVTCAGANVNKEHALRIVIERGPVTLRVGSSSGGDEYIAETALRTGEHSLAFTPTGNFYVQFQSNTRTTKLVDSCSVESSGVMSIATPWTSTEIGEVKYYQSGDVVFCAHSDFQQRRIERRSQSSWSLVKYEPEDGPFRNPTNNGIKITASAYQGDVTLTASRPLWSSNHVGALWRITTEDQRVTHVFTSADQYTNAIRVVGANSDDNFLLSITSLTGTGTTVTLQMSLDIEDDWLDYTTYTTNQSVTINASTSIGGGTATEYINRTRYFRLIVKSGDYSSGTPSGSLTYDAGSKTGIARITAFTSSTSVSAAILEPLSSTNATDVWDEGAWSDARSWPSAVTIHGGRLWWGDLDYNYGSVSDSYESYDDTVDGDSGPVIRSVGSGPIEGIRWLLSMRRLIAGTASEVISIRSSSFDEPITPTAYAADVRSTLGCADLQAVKVDNTALFVQRNAKRVYELFFEGADQDYTPADLTRFKPEMCDAGIVSMAVQRMPDTRIWFVLADGTVALLCYDRTENMVCWVELTFGDGDVEAVAVLPGSDEDDVYLAMRRTINSASKCYIEKLALESECIGGTLNKVMDSHYVYSGSATSTITGLSHLEGEDVVIWSAGAAVRDQTNMATVSSGSVSVGQSVTSAVVGLPYNGKFKSVKLAYGAKLGTALTQTKKIDHLGLILANTAWAGLTYGKDFSTLYNLPKINRGATVDDDDVFATYDAEQFSFGGIWDTDSRVCLQVSGPYPADILAIVIGMTTEEGPGLPEREKRTA